MGLTGQEGLQIVGPLVSFSVFVVGAIVAGRLLRGIPKGWHRRDTVVLSGVAALLVIALVPSLLVPRTPLPVPAALPVTVLLALAMGMQAGAARHIAVIDVTTVVITSTLAALAFDSRLGRSTGQAWFRRLSAVALLALGALAGALLLLVAFWLGLALAAALLVGVAVVGTLGARSVAEDAAPAGQ